MFTFTTREEYLAYRSEWRANYKEITQQIRSLKKDHLEEQRAGKGGYAGGQLRQTRREANQMMLELEAAKEFKNAQLASRQQEAA